jgi:hypothetical protein
MTEAPFPSRFLLTPLSAALLPCFSTAYFALGFLGAAFFGRLPTVLADNIFIDDATSNISTFGLGRSPLEGKLLLELIFKNSKGLSSI